MVWMFLVSSYQKVRWSKCEVEREKIFDGAPPSVGGGGVARPPSERNFYLLKVLNMIIENSKLFIST